MPTPTNRLQARDATWILSPADYTQSGTISLENVSVMTAILVELRVLSYLNNANNLQLNQLRANELNRIIAPGSIT